ncbi:hypothetical protein SAY86_014790 [Trapa natans]|uniref:HTH myb-type domain-containing protein n=1 Tax=Trapa natans TaxID=22666 RepID=A0AAN7KKX3_TRANT|nr:hypothetical protein SAY86_014790 [Trapa natans]
MRESEEGSWFSKWEEELPSPDELMPLTQTLITPDLAAAFDIRSPLNNTDHSSDSPPPPPSVNSIASNHLQPPVLSPHPASAEFSELGELGGTGDEPARTLKRPRLVWTPQLHKRFVDAVAHLGIKNAVPKTIMQLMSVDGLTRENVASHLQKYRLYLKRMQGLSSGGGAAGVGAAAAAAAVADPATEHLFASSPVPPHFLRPNSDHFLPFVSVPTHHHHHQQQMATAAAYQRPVGHFGSAPNGQFEHPFLSRQAAQQQVQRMGPQLHGHGPLQPYMENLEPPANNVNGGGRKVLTLFPTGGD